MRHLTNMDGLHDIMRCLILWIPLQEPNKTKNEVPQKFEKNGITVMPASASPHYEEIWVKLPRPHFCQKRSLISKSE